MDTITKVIDGDTFRTTEDKLRVGNIDTPESVHTNSDRNTEEGKQVSESMSAMLPEGSKVDVFKTDRDDFGRDIADVYRDVGGTKVNMGLVALDQDFSTYYTEHGTHPNPDTHDKYKEYYSPDVPYQFQDTYELDITEDEFNEMHRKHEVFQKVQTMFKDGDATQEQLDAAMADLYSDERKVVNYRRALHNWNKPVEAEDPTTLRGAMRIAMQDPDLRDTYNRAVRNGGLKVTEYAPEDGWWDNLKTSVHLLSGYSDIADLNELWNSRSNQAEVTASEAELVQGLPPEYHSRVLQEATDYSTRSAIVLRDQIREDIEVNKDFDDMSMMAQFGYGAAATLANPLTIATAHPVVRGGKAVVDTAKYWQLSRAIAGKNTIKGAETVTKLTAWAGMGATEGALINSPRLAADHTYTAKDYTLDVMLDAGFGVALGFAGTGIKAGYTGYTNKLRDSRAKTIEEKKNAVINAQREEVSEAVLLQPKETVQIHEALEMSGEQVTAWTQQPSVKVVGNDAVAPLAAVTKVSPEGMRLASQTLKTTFPDKTPMRYLLNRTTGLNGRDLPDDVAEEVTKLNADVLHVASAFPNGKVPKNVGKAISNLTFSQKQLSTNNAIADVLQGTNVKSQESTLEGYVKALRGKTELWGNTPITKFDSDTFIRMQSDWLNSERSVNDDTLLSMRAELPKQMSYLKDLVELNTLAQKTNSTKLTELVEELNGMAVRRIREADEGELTAYSDSSKSWGATVEMSPQEIAAQLKKEGLRPRTTEYSDRLKELRKSGRAAVSDDINQLGRLDEQVVGETVEELDSGSYYTSDDALGELQSLESKPAPSKEDVKRIAQLKKQLSTGSTQARTKLVKEDFEQDLLPRSFIESTSNDAFKEPTLENVRALRKQLNNNVIRKLGTKVIPDVEDPQHVTDRLNKVKQDLLADKQDTLNNMVTSGQWQNVEDVMRASAQIAEEKKYYKPTDATEQVDITPLTETDLELVTDYVAGVSNHVPEEVMQPLVSKVNDAYEKMVQESVDKVGGHLTKFDGSSEKVAWELAKKPTGLVDSTGRAAAKITEDLASKFQNSKLNSLEYVGSRITELGKGYGGNIRREATGGLIRDGAYKEGAMQFAPQYVRAMDDFAKERGAGAWKRLKAQWQAGADSPLVKEFNREMFTLQELRRQGKDTSQVSDSVKQFAEDWDKFTSWAHDQLVDNNIGGFTKDRKVKHYIPHVWKPERIELAIKQHGRDKVVTAFERAYQSAINNGTNPSKLHEARELAERQVDWIIGQLDEGDAIDQYSPVKDSRAKARLDLDTTTEFEGVSILELMDNDIINVGTKYVNRLAGWVGLSKSTSGAITSQLDIDTLGKMIKEEGVQKGINTDTYEQYYDDLINLMFGRPTRGGLTTELRELSDLTALTRMGGLGMAQLIESGTVITRSVLATFSSDPVVRKVFAVAGESVEDKGLLREIQSVASISDQLEYLDRQSVHLDQAELDKVSKQRQVSLWVADKATFGANKAPASRLLGKVTGYNAIRKIQSRVVQASFTVDVAKHFKDGSGKMSHARLADLGLTDVDGTDVGLQEVFDTLVEYDSNGLVSKLNFDKWPKAERDRFQFAMLRDDAQQIQRTLVGELPPWMNKPLVALTMQFRQMPIVANNKQLARSMAFADREAVIAVMLNTAISGLVRYSKFAALGTGVALLIGEEAQEPTSEQLQVSKYIAQLGVYADATDLVLDAIKAGQADSPKDAFYNGTDVVLNQVPVLGLMQDYATAGKAALNTAGAEVDTSTKEQIDAAFGLMPLGNIAMADMIHAWLNEQYGE